MYVVVYYIQLILRNPIGVDGSGTLVIVAMHANPLQGLGSSGQQEFWALPNCSQTQTGKITAASCNPTEPVAATCRRRGRFGNALD